MIETEVIQAIGVPLAASNMLQEDDDMKMNSRRIWSTTTTRGAMLLAAAVSASFVYVACGKTEAEQSTETKAALHVGDSFERIRVTVDMEETSVELPVPNYVMVDVAGDFKNAEDSVACGGAVSEGTAEDADDCLLRPEVTFTNGYMDTNGTVVTPNAATYNGKVADFEVVGHVGDIVEMTVNNKLPKAENGEAIDTGFFAPANNLQSVHWHGMELDNESDGTPATETAIPVGNSRLYRYRLYRPGLFWFHPHILPLLTESRGMVGRLVIRSDAEETLENIGVLPTVYEAITLSDVEVANEFNRTALGPGNVVFPHFTDEEVDNHLMPDISPDLNNDGMCDRGVQGRDCIVREGELVMVNGKIPTSDNDIPTVEVEEGGGARIAFVDSSNERFYRFRLLLEGEAPPSGPAQRVGQTTTGQCYADATSPKFSGADPLSCEQGLPLYRVGGEGGILDKVRLEGQAELAPGEAAREFDTVIRTGEDVIGPSERTEFVVVTKDRQGNYLQAGQSMFIWTIDFPHGIFTPKFDNMIGDGSARNRDISARKLVRIKIVPNTGTAQFDIAVDDPLLMHPAVNRPTENLKVLPLASLAVPPAGNDPAGNPFAGTTDNNILLGNRVAADGTRFPSINDVRGQYSGIVGGIGDTLPTQDNTRFAHVGDVIEFVYANDTIAAHHPFHMHGFSFQPISVHSFDTADANSDGIQETIVDPAVLFEYDYNEFIDVIQTQPGTATRFRMKMNDRFKIPDGAHYSIDDILERFPFDGSEDYGGEGDIENQDADMGGALGRWLFHCHILHHAGLGMISDLCIAPEGASDASGCKIDVDENISQPIDVLSFQPFASWTPVTGSGDIFSGVGSDGNGLAVTSGGYTEFVSEALTTDLVLAKSPSGSPTHAVLDLNISSDQPNPSWLGLVQLYISIPSAGINHDFQGQVELTGLPTGQFTTVQFALSSAVQTALQSAHDDIQFFIGTNTNAGAGAIVMDDLRFDP